MLTTKNIDTNMKVRLQKRTKHTDHNYKKPSMDKTKYGTQKRKKTNSNIEGKISVPEELASTALHAMLEFSHEHENSR